MKNLLDGSINGVKTIFGGVNEPWIYILLGACVLLSLAWMFLASIKRLRVEKGAISAGLGKSLGGLTIGLLVIVVGLGSAIGLVYVLESTSLATTLGAVGKVPFIGGLLAWILGGIARVIFPVILGLTVVYGIYRAILSILVQLISTFTGAAKDYTDNDAPHEVKTSYQVCGSLFVAIVICNPLWNVNYYFVPALLSAAFGLYTLITKTTYRRELVE